MSVATSALQQLVDSLAEAIDGEPVRVENAAYAGPEAPSDSAVTLRPVALNRLGRSLRDGPILDLELVVRVAARGPRALDLVEQAMLALEPDSRYTLDEPQDAEGLGFLIRARVGVRLEEPVGPPVQEPLRIDLRPVRSLVGVVVDAEGRGVPQARVATAVGGPPRISDEHGRFRILGSPGPRQQFQVEVAGMQRSVDCATDASPVVIRWE